jgi:outer membrane protein insertion porin family
LPLNSSRPSSFRASVPLLVATILLALAVGPANAPARQDFEPYGKTIESVEILGLRNADRAAILRAAALKEGEVYTRANERSTTTNLWNLYLFRNVGVRGAPGEAEDTVRAIFEVEEQPVAASLSIEGNAAYPDEEIGKVLTFKEKGIFPSNAAAATELAVKQLYVKKGYNDISVAVESETLLEGAVKVVVKINEGRRVAVDDIIILGNNAFTAWRLGFHMQTGESWLFVSNYFNRALFDLDLESIADFYKSQGYLKATVKEGESRLSEDGQWITLEIVVDEGPLFTVRDIRFEGFTLFTEEELRAPFESIVGEPFYRNSFQAAMDKIRYLYGDSGWTQVLFDLKPVYPADQGEEGAPADVVDLVVQVAEGQRITVGAVRYEERDLEVPESEIGAVAAFWMKLAPPVDKEVVLKRVRMKSGEPLKLTDLEETKRSLKRMRLFRDVEIVQQPTDLPGVRDILVKTTPADTAWLYLGASTGESGGVTGRVRLTERNLFGAADGLDLSASFGRDSVFSLSYLDRDLGATDFSARYTLYRSAYRRRGYDEETYGLTTLFSRPLSDRITESYRLRLEDVNIDKRRRVLADLDDYQVAAVRYRQVVDYRDDVDWPTEGYSLGADVEGGYADTTFVNVGVDYDIYRRLHREIVWAASIRADVIPTPTDRDDLGIGERLFLGGRGTVRGFRSRGIGPVDEGDRRVALGGLTRGVLRNEIRFPIAGEALKGLVFADAGFLDEDAFAWDTPRASTGFGLRLLDDRINIGVDFGWALNDRHNDRTQVFSFTIDSGI